MKHKSNESGRDTFDPKASRDLHLELHREALGNSRSRGLERNI